MKKKGFISVSVLFIFVGCLWATDSMSSNKVYENKTGSFTEKGKIKPVKDRSSFTSSATDYFRSVASGAWNNVSTWESSPDSIAPFVPATVAPGMLASHVVIQGPDSVWLTTNITTINLTILSGAKLNALARTMTVTWRFNLLGTAFFYQGGNVYPVPGVEQVLDPASTYVYNGTQIGLNAAYPEFGNLVFEPSSAFPGTFENTIAAPPFNNGLVVRGDLTVDLQQDLTRDVSFATGSTISRTHTIDGDLNIGSYRTNIIIQRGDATGGTTGTVNLGGNLNNYAGFLFALGYTSSNTGIAVLNIAGDINNYSGLISTGLSSTGSYSLNFVGTTPQSINNSSGTLTNTNLQVVNINNPAGVILNTPVLLEGDLNFITGILKTTNVNLLTMGAGTSVTGASDLGFVDGPIKKTGNTAFTFPTGKTGYGYVPIGIGNFFGGTASDEFTAEYMRASARDLPGGITAIGLERVSRCEYWILDKGLATPASLDVTVYWNANSPCFGDPYVTNPNTLTVAHYNGSSWNSFATSKIVTPGSTNAAGSVTWPGATEFSPFSLGSTSFGDNPLPVTINYFNGVKQNNNHLLNWKLTCNSTPYATVELQRSSNGSNYTAIFSEQATALRCQQPFAFTDDKPVTGINYYRIKMTDAEGHITYSSVVSLINANRGIDILNIAPNPVVNRNFKLNISAAQKTQIEIVITDMQGRVVQKQPAYLIAGFNTIPVHVASKLAAGTYQLFINMTDGRSKIQRFVIQ